MTAARPLPIKVLHVITGLGAGGAERQLATLALRTNPARVRHEVVTLMDDGVWGPALRAGGIPVHALGLSRSSPSPLAALKLAGLIRESRADIVQTWLYHADLAGLLADGLAGLKPLIWTLRCSNMRLEIYGARARLVVRALALLSRLPNAVAANSTQGQRWHQSLGYRPRRWALIPNGVDTDEFAPDPEARRILRQEFGLPMDARLIGCLSRHDPMKDHPTLLGAFAWRSSNEWLVLAGEGTEETNPKLTAQIVASGVDPVRVIRLGLRRDVPALTAALDVAVLSSAFGEGFPNVVAEAMACGIPCAATDIGDTAMLLKGCGEVVPPGDPQALTTAIDKLLALDPAARAELGAKARKRIETDYSVETMVSAYARLYDALLDS